MATLAELNDKLAQAKATRDALNAELLEATKDLRPAKRDALAKLKQELAALNTTVNATEDATVKAALAPRIEALTAEVATAQDEISALDVQAELDKVTDEIDDMKASGRPIRAAAGTASVQLRC